MPARTGGDTRCDEPPGKQEQSDMSPEGLTPPAAAAAELTLTPPEPVAAVAPAHAGELVPIERRRCRRSTPRSPSTSTGSSTSTCTRPRSRPRPATSRSMGDDDIRAAADTSNRLLASPVRAMQQGPLSEGGKVAATLLDLRRTIEDLDPKEATGAKQAARADPVRRQDPRLLPQVRERADAPRRDHQGALRRPGRAAQGQRRARAGEGAPLGDDAAPRPVHLHRGAPRRGARREDRRRSRRPTPRRPRRCATTCCSTCARSTRTC